MAENDLYVLTKQLSSMDKKLDDLSCDVRETKVDIRNIKEMQSSFDKKVENIEKDVEELKLWKASNDGIQGWIKNITTILISLIAVLVSIFKNS